MSWLLISRQLISYTSRITIPRNWTLPLRAHPLLFKKVTARFLPSFSNTSLLFFALKATKQNTVVCSDWSVDVMKELLTVNKMSENHKNEIHKSILLGICKWYHCTVPTLHILVSYTVARCCCEAFKINIIYFVFSSSYMHWHSKTGNLVCFSHSLEILEWGLADVAVVWK